MVKKQITGKEINNRLKYVLLGFFIFYLVAPLRDWINENLSINPILFGIIGLVFVLWYFDF